MSVLQGLKVLQVGPGLGAAVCGRLFADVGADVNCFKPGRDTPLAEHLNNGKLSLTALPESTDIVLPRPRSTWQREVCLSGSNLKG